MTEMERKKERSTKRDAERGKEQMRKMIKLKGEVLCKKTLEDKGV